MGWSIVAWGRFPYENPLDLYLGVGGTTCNRPIVSAGISLYSPKTCRNLEAGSARLLVPDVYYTTDEGPNSANQISPKL